MKSGGFCVFLSALGTVLPFFGGSPDLPYMAESHSEGCRSVSDPQFSPSLVVLLFPRFTTKRGAEGLVTGLPTSLPNLPRTPTEFSWPFLMLFTRLLTRKFFFPS